MRVEEFQAILLTEYKVDAAHAIRVLRQAVSLVDPVASERALPANVRAELDRALEAMQAAIGLLRASR